MTDTMSETALAAYLSERKHAIDAALDAALPPAESEPAAVHEAMRYAVLEGGKRLRPLLCLTVAELAGERPDELLDAACALECIHAASLILDDLPAMDNAAMRRDRAAVHVLAGESTALLAAMGLVALAFDHVARNAESLGRPELAAPCVRQLAWAMGTEGLTCGQYVDLTFRHAGSSEASVEEAYAQKAGALFVAAVEIPAVLTGLSHAKRHALRSFAERLGLAFQITDDLLDAQVGGEDAGKATFATHLGEEGSRRKMAGLITAACDALAPFGASAAPLKAFAAHVRQRAR
jgi:geranylgeranyl pyrophosphate synthase